MAISITGTTCVGDVLTAVTNSPGSSIVWKRDGSNTVATQTAALSTAGITVAGGNGNGSAANQLSNPNRIYIDASGNLYIPDMSNSRIQKWSPGATVGITVAGGNGIGSAANQFNRPTSVSIDSKGNLFVTDQTNGRIQKWAPGATTGVTIAQGLAYPTCLFIDRNDNIYVSEQHGSTVTKWPQGATSGVIVAGGNGYGSGANQLAAPTGIFVDAAGNLYICDTDNNRIQKWAPGATSGTTVAGGFFGSGLAQLANPLGVYVDNVGNVYITDFNNYRVQKWAPGATAGVTVAGGNGQGSGANQLNQPAGISMDSDCNLYISDFYNHRVQKFSTATINTYKTTEPGTYTATLVRATGNTISNSIIVSAPKMPVVNIVSDHSQICSGTAVTFNATVADPGTNAVIQWKKNGVSVGTNSNTFTDNALADGDVITCVFTSNVTCLPNAIATSNSITMKVRNSSPKVNIGADISICPGKTATFNASSYASYLWQDGSTGSSYTTAKAGKYHVEVRDFCGTVSADTVTVSVHPLTQDFLPINLILCDNGPGQIKSSAGFKEYLWSTNAATQTIDVTSPGLYWLRVVDENDCEATDTTIVIQQPCLKKLVVPNAFTPNHDGKNDGLRPVFLGNIQSFKFTVYNRWGQLVFMTTDIAAAWSGTLNGKNLESNTFVWTCSYQFVGEAARTEKGTVFLAR